jgi:tRNA threonylcarbamoyladenosine biosynthesis protein TsaE
MRRFAISDKRFANFYHIDCYRIDSPKELMNLDFKKIIERPENLVVIEWAEKVKSFIPKKATWLKFNWLSENKRQIVISKNA